MKKKYKLIILFVGIFFVISLVIGVSYAMWVFSVSQSDSNIVITDCFEITYTDSDAINITNTIPLTDKEARELTPYQFTITNVCNSIMKYNVNIETLNESTMDLDAVAVKLDNKAKKVLGTIGNNDSSEIVNTSNASSSKTIFSDYLKAGESKTHNLRLWIDEDATLEQSANKNYSSKIVVNTSLATNYSEATLISGPLFNKAIKQLAGDEPTQNELDNYNNFINGTNYNPDDYPADYNIYNYIVRDENIKNVTFSSNAPSNNVNTVVVSTNDSDTNVLAWFDTDTIYLYSNANKIYLNENSAYYFNRLRSVENIDLSKFDTSKSTNMRSMFQSLGVISTLDLSNFDTSNVTDMSYMFTAPKLTSLDLSSFDTSKVTNMSNMFQSCLILPSLDLSNFDTSNVTNMSNMFQDMNSLIELDVSSFDTSKVTDMSYMFNYLSKLPRLDLSNFDTSNVTDMQYMFSSLSILKELNVSSFDTSKVTDMSYMFANLYLIPTLDVSSFDTRNATNMNYMFASVQTVKTIYVGDNWSTSQLPSTQSVSASAWTLVGAQGTKVSSGFNKEYQRIDCAPTSPGYFTYKGPLGDTAAYCATLN